MTYAAYIHDHKLEFIKNPLDRDEAKEILKCKNLGEMDIEIVYHSLVLLWDADEPDIDNIIPIVKKQTSWKKVIDKSKYLICGIPEGNKIGIKNRYGCGSITIDQ